MMFDSLCFRISRGSTALVVFCGVVLLAGATNGQGAGPVERTVIADDRSSEFLNKMDQHARQTLKHDPLTATYFGIGSSFTGERLGGQMPDLSPDGLEQLRALDRQLHDTLTAFERSSLTGQAKVTYDVMQAVNKTRLGLLEATSAPSVAISNELFLANQIWGIQQRIAQTMQVQQKVSDTRDADDYIHRLEQIDELLDQAVACIDRDAEAGVIPPRFALTKAARGILAFVKPDPIDSSLVATFREKLKDAELPLAQRNQFEARAVRIVRDAVYPAYRRLASTLESYRRQSPGGAGVWRIPNGAAIYRILLDANGAAGKSADDIHALGLTEVARISDDLDGCLRQQDLTQGSVGERLKELFSREQYLYENTDDGRRRLLNDLNGQLAEIAAKLPRYFGNLPPQSVEVRRIPAYEQEGAPGGYYTPPPVDGSASTPGIYWINLRDTAEWPSWTLKTLTYHEANPGHHLQGALALANEDTPVIRKIRFFNPFGEGWALYAEKLAAEMGMYQDDPLGNIGRLQAELFRAVRLVVDTGLHHKKWTREQAIEYMVNTLGNPESEATTEVERYAVWPGQACSYKLGMIMMEELRSRAKSTLGDRFDLRSFHDVVLSNGDIPLAVLEAYVNDWIEQVATRDQ